MQLSSIYFCVVLLVGAFFMRPASAAWGHFEEGNQQADSGLATTAFRNVGVIDVEKGVLIPEQTVVVTGRQIVFVGRQPRPALLEGARIVDASGLYLSPGFWDMHVHLAGRGAERLMGPAMVANGVLYARDMNGDCVGEECDRRRNVYELRELQADIESGHVLAPRIVSAASYPVEGPGIAYNNLNRPREPSFLAPANAPDGGLFAKYSAERGVDFIKPYDSLPREAYFGMTEEAGRLNLKVAGHVPKSLLLIEAIEAGQHTIEHAKMLPIACSDMEEPFRKAYENWTNLNREELLHTDKEESGSAPHMSEYYQAALSTRAVRKCRGLLKAWAATESYYVPTHLTRLAEAIVHTRPFLHDPRSEYIDPVEIREGWEREAGTYEARFAASPALERAYMDFHLRGLELTGDAHEAGVKILVGTDLGDTLIYPGFSFHDEMAFMVEAGMPPSEVLRSATLTAAESEGLEATEGRIAINKAANFVLYRRNPLLDIANTTTIEAVYYQGRYHDRASLDELLAAVRMNAVSLNP